MSIELQTPKVDLHLQDEEKREERLKNIEQENRIFVKNATYYL